MEEKKLRSININGVGKYTGGEFDCVNISGTGKVEGYLKCNELNAAGTVGINGDLAAKKATVSGTAKIEGDLSGEQIRSNGVVTCSGLLNCENLELQLAGKSYIHEIGATTIKVEESSMSIGRLLSFLIPKKYKSNKLIATTIEGDEIYLENCEAKVVRGKHVTIGPNCNIETIEYMETLEVNEESTVGNSVKQ